MWTVLGYALSPTQSVIDEWLRSASDDAVGKFDGRLKFMGERLSGQWNYQHAHQLRGECKGLWEIKFEAENIAYRPLFCLQPNWRIVVVLFAIEHNKKLRPVEACKTALRRCGEIRDGTAKALVYDDY